MTPDKVYLQEGFSVSVVGFVSPAWDNPKDKENVVEYVRKEALLEWANKRLEEFRQIAEISNDVAADGEVDAFEELIEKLNEV